MIAAPRLRLSHDDWRNLRTALPFVLPWVIGFFAFTLYPIIYSLCLGFNQYSGCGDAVPVGIANYKHMVSDPLFWKALYNTGYYTALAVPIGLVVAIVLALLMNQNLREVAIYRAAFYLPSILPLFALTFIFIVLLNPRFGAVNYFLGFLHVPTINWLGDARWTKVSVVILAQMGAGRPALIFLALPLAVPVVLLATVRRKDAAPISRFRLTTL